MMHSMKMEINQQLEMIILQSITDKEPILLASLAILNKYNTVPYIPSFKVKIAVVH